MLTYTIDRTKKVLFKDIQNGQLFQLIFVEELGECKKLDQETFKFWGYEGPHLTGMTANITPDTECYLYLSSIYEEEPQKQRMKNATCYDDRQIELTQVEVFFQDDLGGMSQDYLILENDLIIDLEREELIEKLNGEILNKTTVKTTVNELLPLIRYSETHLYKRAFKELMTAYYHA